ncbi:MAG: hypothetical protein CSA22_00970 [Deltaproteobacteria bacterium]|nr:MAG: hypothetical protein CSA22_00970 [Deltaproteobacteria bacterium]
MKYIHPTSDIFIKYLFGMEADSPLLKDFINATQQQYDLPRIKSLTVRNPFNLKTIHFEKESVLDIKAISETGEIFNIEVQTSGNEIFKNRSLYYWSKLYTAQLEQGKAYKVLHPVICINILDFNLFSDESRYHLCFMLRDLKDPELFLTDHLAIHYLELPKLSHYHTDNELEKWLYYLKHEGKPEEDEQMRILLKENPNLKKAHEKYVSFTLDSELVDAYEAHMKWKRDYATGVDEARTKGREEGRQEGRQEGSRQSKMEIAKKMLDKGAEIDFISECTGIDPNALKKIL